MCTIIPKEVHLDKCPVLGRGAFGKVVKPSDGNFAVKVIRTDRNNDKAEELKNEFDLLKSLGESDYFVEAYELRKEPDRILIFMEYMPGGTLRRLITQSTDGRLSEFKTTAFAYQLLCAVQFMHAKGIMNRDIKCTAAFQLQIELNNLAENILLDRTQKYLKVCDFGLGKVFSTERSHTQTFCGTVIYMAPELVNGRYGKKAELWSVGIIIVEMLKGDPPHHELDKCQFMFKIWLKREFKYELPLDTSADMRALVGQLLSLDPKIRPSASEALEHQLFKKIYCQGRPCTGLKLSCPNDDLDEIIKTALDNKLHIYALVPQSECIDGEYKKTDVYYIPDLHKIIVVKDDGLSSRLFPVTATAISGTDTIVSSNAIHSFFALDRRAQQGMHSSDAHLAVRLIVSDPDSDLANANGKVKISFLTIQINNALDASTLPTIVNHIAANVQVTDLRWVGGAQHVPNLCESLREMDGGLNWIELDAIDLSGEKRLAATLKCIKTLRHLTLKNTGIGEDALVQIGGLKLVHLCVHNESCLLQKDTVGRLLSAVKCSSKTEMLSLTDNKLNASHLSGLRDFLPRMKKVFKLLEIDDFEGSTAFVQQLEADVGSNNAYKLEIGDDYEEDF